MLPLTMPCQEDETPESVKPFWTTPRNRTPIIVPNTPPSPPVLNATVSCIAQGENRSSSSGAGSPTTQIIERFTQFSGLVKRDGVPLGNIVSGTFNYANNLGKVEVIRPDGRIGGIDPAQIVVDGQIVVRFADAELLNLAIGNTPIEMVFQWQIAAAKSLTILMPTVYLPRPRLAVTGPGAVQATFDYNATQSGASGRSCVITLVNDISTY